MKRLSFYIANNDYVDYLKSEETKARGFTRVPNLVYSDNQKQKFLCGIVFEHNGLPYFVPVSSYKQRQRDNFLIYNEDGRVLSSLRFNYMFPIPANLVTEYDISSIEDQKYRFLIQNELRYCRHYQSAILHRAAKTYERVTEGKDPFLQKNACDFRLLEKCCREYEAAHSPATARAASEKASRRDVDPEI